MAIYNTVTEQLQKGFTKKVSDSGFNMVFDTLQRYQYSYPIKSTVRELLSNAIDSVLERNRAWLIIQGKSKKEDYFVEREGELYEDSKFTPGYYNLKWLSNIDTVEISYHINNELAKDYVVIKDYGVGLGGTRLEHYFELGFSTKRLNKFSLGKWGIGAKSPLSVGVDMYTMESRYNGKLFRFNIYSRDVYSIIPQFNLETGKENSFVLFAEGTEHEYKVYYEDTTEFNGVTVTIEAKKHHKEQYIDAVKSQMLYFPSVQLSVVEGNTSTIIPHYAKILYEDDFIVLSDNNYYSAPHLLLNRVNYGLIDWNELELENKRGNIGIKVSPEDVDVSPSRESVLWSELTKEKVKKRFDDVVMVATKMIQEELKEPDIIKWMKKSYEVSAHYTNRTDILGRLANIVDLTRVNPAFVGDPKITFKSSNPLQGTMMKYINWARKEDKVTGEVKKFISRTIVESLYTYYNLPIYLFKSAERANNLKDKYLLSIHPNGFIVLYEPMTKETAEQQKEEDVLDWLKALSKKGETARFSIWEFVKKSSEVKWYEHITVPDSFKGTDELEEIEVMAKEEAIKQAKENAVTAAERRKQTGSTIIRTLYSDGGFHNQVYKDKELVTTSAAYFGFTTLEYPIADINKWKEDEIYYGNEEHAELMHLVGLITLPKQKTIEIKLGTLNRSYATIEDWKFSMYYKLDKKEIESVNQYRAYSMFNFFDCSVRVVKVSQSNNKLYRDFKHITEFFLQIKDNSIIMSDSLIRWNTARIVFDALPDFSFLYNFEYFNPEVSTIYKELTDYVCSYYRKFTVSDKITGLGGTTYSDMIAHLDNVRKFQEFVQSGNNDAQSVSELARELFDNPTLTDGTAVDPEIIRKLRVLQEYRLSCGDLLNYVGQLTGTLTKPTTYSAPTKEKPNITPELELEIRKYLEYKGMFNWNETT